MFPDPSVIKDCPFVPLFDGNENILKLLKSPTMFPLKLFLIILPTKTFPVATAELFDPSI